MMRPYCVAAALVCVASPLRAGNLPAWWTASQTQIIQSGATQNNYAPVNNGQLKYVAVQAKAYLDANLAGGAGSTINAMVAAFKPQSGVSYTQAELDQIKRDNYAPATIGQLKAVAKPFYDRLIAAGYFTKINLIAHGYPADWTDAYPWNSVTPVPVSQNYVLANLGQLKAVFSFNLSDADADGLPDAWESQMTGQSGGDGSWLSTLVGDGVHDADGDGISDLAEYEIGWNALVNNLNNTAETETIIYNNANRVTNITGRSTLGYTTDASGNLTQATP
jgi:hypothetical protein